MLQMDRYDTRAMRPGSSAHPPRAVGNRALRSRWAGRRGTWLLNVPARLLVLTGCVVMLSFRAGAGVVPSGTGASPKHPYLEAHARQAALSTADHSKFAALKGPFADGDGPAVTKACLTCHPKAGDQVMGTKHWLWRVPEKKYEAYGKGGWLINNFCISIRGGNYPACTKCHAGYGWKDSSFDFTKTENEDCLVCHDTTGDYMKDAAGLANPAVPLDEVAQHVGRPGIANCGGCHFSGGGADATKHGDLDESLLDCKKSEDVHLAKSGAGMDCVDCHTTEGHHIAGPDYLLPANMQETPQYPGQKLGHMSCVSCHGEAPHASFVLNRHYRKVACQTCHIPAFARGGLATNVWWDWSTAGRTKNGQAYEEKDKDGNVTYATIHGSMVWKKNVLPTYEWFDGRMSFMLATDKLPAQRPVWLNKPLGSYDDPSAKIWPFKVHEGKQPYDTQLDKLVVPHLYGDKGSGAFWVDHDWATAIKTGMEIAGLPYSGHYGFVRTNMIWPITHMVAPAKDALTCMDCHSKKSRLSGVKGFYLPGRDRSSGIDFLGWAAVLISCVAVVVHGSGRIFFNTREKRDSK